MECRKGFNALLDNGCSLEENFGSGAHLHERIKDIDIMPKQDDFDNGHGLKKKEADLRQSIREKLYTTTNIDSVLRNTDSRPGVSIWIINISQFNNLSSKIKQLTPNGQNHLNSHSMPIKQGDGESVPETPPNEDCDESSSTESKKDNTIRSVRESQEGIDSMGKEYVNNPFAIQVRI